MFKSIKTFLFISIAIVLAGCAGRDFVRPTQEAFKLGTTTYAQIVQQLGEPRRVGTLLKNDKSLKSITYAFAATGGEPLEAGVIPARAMGYYFLNDTLVGLEFVSSFKSDNSDFDETRIAAIAKGKTTRAEVIQLLGRPSGSYIPPMVKETSGEAVGYTYIATKGGAFSGFKFFRKSLLISFNESDQVSDVEFSSSGSK
jgi:hypothetical protein